METFVLYYLHEDIKAPFSNLRLFLLRKITIFNRLCVGVRMNCNLNRLVDTVYMNYLIFLDYIMKRSQSEAKLTVCTNSN